jgi:hypothetical protein
MIKFNKKLTLNNKIKKIILIIKKKSDRSVAGAS